MMTEGFAVEVLEDVPETDFKKELQDLVKDRITQLITTCTGIDDWEWGVTLFARDLKSIRDIVYELRYDEASAIYGLFGAFYIGIRFQPDQPATVLRL